MTKLLVRDLLSIVMKLADICIPSLMRRIRAASLQWVQDQRTWCIQEWYFEVFVDECRFEFHLDSERICGEDQVTQKVRRSTVIKVVQLWCEAYQYWSKN